MVRALIPMAGEGSRFQKAGYTFPKPLIDVSGKSMIELVLTTLPSCDEYIFLCRSYHVEQYDLETMLDTLTDGKARVITIDEGTEGAACTALLAKEFINDEQPLLIANSDQYVEYDKRNFSILSRHSGADGIIFCFNASHPKWSFVRTIESGLIVEVAEKKPISNIATCGIYFFARGCDFVAAAEQMISKDIRTDGEFYLAPVYNEMTQRHNILPFFVDKMHGLGTPEDLENFIQRR